MKNEKKWKSMKSVVSGFTIHFRLNYEWCSKVLNKKSSGFDPSVGECLQKQ